MGKKAWDDVIIVDGNEVPGKRIIKTIGKVKTICNSKSLPKNAQFRVKAPDKLKKIAHKLGANAITSVRFEIRDEYLNYNGTAVIVEDDLDLLPRLYAEGPADRARNDHLVLW